MTLSVSSFLEPFLLGIGLAAPMGPVSLEMLRRGLERGFWAAFQIRLGGVFGNFLCLLVAMWGMTAMVAHPVVLRTLGGLGGGALIFMGLKNIYRSYKGVYEAPKKTTPPAKKNPVSGFVWGFYLSLANPVALAFWPGTFAQHIAEKAHKPMGSLGHPLLILVGVLAWGALLAYIAGYAGKRLSHRVLLGITWVSSIIVIFFGGRYLFKSLMGV